MTDDGGGQTAEPGEGTQISLLLPIQAIPAQTQFTQEG